LPRRFAVVEREGGVRLLECPQWAKPLCDKTRGDLADVTLLEVPQNPYDLQSIRWGETRNAPPRRSGGY